MEKTSKTRQIKTGTVVSYRKALYFVLDKNKDKVVLLPLEAVDLFDTNPNKSNMTASSITVSIEDVSIHEAG